MANPIVFFDMTIGGEPVGRMEMELYADECPITAENFRALCTGEKGIGRQGMPLHYRGSSIYSVVPLSGYCYVTGGDIIKKGYNTGGESIYGDYFKNEKSKRRQDKPGTLSMYTKSYAGIQGNASQFFISTGDSPLLKKSYSAFGQVVSGINVLKAIETTTRTGKHPTKPVIIADCGQIVNGKAYEQKVTPEVFFDIAIGGKPSGRIIMKLFYDTTPVTVQNFRSLCTGDKAIGKISGKPLHYKGTTFQRIIPGVMCHGGDFALKDGTGGEPISGAHKFLSENFVNKHTGPGILSMVNSGTGASGSQFFICTTKTDWLDGKHVVFGEVVQGMGVVKAMEDVGLPDGTTTMPVTIIDCGEINFDYPKETVTNDEEPY